MKRICLSLSFVLVATACYQDPRLSDSGHTEFYRQALPKVLGRRALGANELRFLNNVTNAVGPSGRRLVLRAMMNSNEYVDHWEQVLSDQLRVHRDGATSLRSCYDDATTSSADSWRLAAMVRDYPPDVVSWHSQFRMPDLIQSSLRLDDLSPVFRAHLFPMVSRTITGANITEKNRRDDLAFRFLSTYLDRDLSCTRCHNSRWSTSGEDSGWDRTHPIQGYFELALFGAHQGAPLENVSTLFRSASSGPSFGGISGSSRPWNLSSTCGSFTSRGSVANDPYAFDGISPHLGAFASIQERSGRNDASVWELEASLHTGIETLKRRGLSRSREEGCAQCAGCDSASSTPGPNYSDAANEAQRAFRENCNTCHGSGFLRDLGSSNWEDRMVRVPGSNGDPLIVPGNARGSRIYKRVESGDMPDDVPFATGWNKEDFLAAMEDWIDSMPESRGCGLCADDACSGVTAIVDPDAAFAYLTATQLVNKTYSEVYGTPLTISNHFPRNSEQMGRLWNLTEFTLLDRYGWSLRRVLERLLSSRKFNRMAPAARDGTEPYEIVPVLEPWSVADPRDTPSPTPEQEFNAMTDGIHPHSAYTKLRMLHRAMEWPAPRRMANDSDFPTQDFQLEIGRFVDDAKPGFNGVDFAGLLAWEAVVGTCRNPDSSADFIDDLVARAGTSSSYTYRDVAAALKDRLVSDASLSSAEESALEQLFAVASIDNRLSGGGLEDKLRNYCGAILESPQFLLAGLPVPGAGPEDSAVRPRISLYSYQQACMNWKDELEAEGYEVDCTPELIRLDRRWPSIRDAMGNIFYRGAAASIPMEWIMECEDGLNGCMNAIPACDPSCFGPDCCGDDMSLAPADDPSAFVSNLEGAKVEYAEGVEVSWIGDPAGRRELKPGEVLEFGTVLYLDEGDTLYMHLEDAQLSTPKGGVLPRKPIDRPEQEQQNDIKLPPEWALVITGPSGLEYAESLRAPEGAIPYKLVDFLNGADYHVSGSAGRPLNRGTLVERLPPDFPRDKEPSPDDYTIGPLVPEEKE